MEAIMQAAKNTYPDEFIAMLGCKKEDGKIIDEFVLLPSTFGKTFSSIRLDLLPYTSGVKGSVHSHPGPYAQPSKSDLKAFKRMGEIHLIIAQPFSFDSTNAFDANGNSIELEVIA